MGFVLVLVVVLETPQKRASEDEDDDEDEEVQFVSSRSEIGGFSEFRKRIRICCNSIAHFL